jgi:hypothetical protein
MISYSVASFLIIALKNNRLLVLYHIFSHLEQFNLKWSQEGALIFSQFQA